MIVAISGVGGVGKTSTAEELVKRLNKKRKGKDRFKLVVLNKLAEKSNAYLGFDKKRQSKIVKIGKLKAEVKKLSKLHPNIVMEGHFSHFFPADIVIILRCEPKTLEKRLKKKYDWPTKITENLEAEMISLITEESLPIHRPGTVFEVDTTRSTKAKTAKIIEEIVDGKGMKYSAGSIDWLKGS